MSSETTSPQRGSRMIGIGLLSIGIAGIIFVLSFENKKFPQVEQSYLPAGQHDYNNGTSIYFIDVKRDRVCNAFFSSDGSKSSVLFCVKEKE